MLFATHCSYGKKCVIHTIIASHRSIHDHTVFTLIVSLLLLLLIRASPTSPRTPTPIPASLPPTRSRATAATTLRRRLPHKSKVHRNRLLEHLFSIRALDRRLSFRERRIFDQNITLVITTSAFQPLPLLCDVCGLVWWFLPSHTHSSDPNLHADS